MGHLVWPIQVTSVDGTEDRMEVRMGQVRYVLVWSDEDTDSPIVGVGAGMSGDETAPPRMVVESDRVTGASIVFDHGDYGADRIEIDVHEDHLVVTRIWDTGPGSEMHEDLVSEVKY